MIDLEEFTRAHWGLARRHAYRLTGSALDADDVAQDAMLRAIEMGPALARVADHSGWLCGACAEAALSRLRERDPLRPDEFDLPDPAQTAAPGANGEAAPPDAEAGWPGVALDFLFPLQYMTPDQRAVAALRDGIEDGDRVAAAALGVKIQEVFRIAEGAEAKRAQVEKRWGGKVPLAPVGDRERAGRVFGRFVEALGMRDKALLQGLLAPEAELVVRGERRTGDDFVALACAELLGQMGERLTFSPVWLNGRRGALVWTWRARRAEWMRCGAIAVLNDESGVKAMKWHLDGHLLRAIRAEAPRPS